MKRRHPFAPQVIACYSLSLLQRVRRAAASLLNHLTNWRT